MAKRKKKGMTSPTGEVEDPKDEYLSLFVLNKKDEVVGESIGVEGDKLIIKSQDQFYEIPLGSVVIEEKKLRLKAKVNWKKAKKAGDRWKTKELDPL